MRTCNDEERFYNCLLSKQLISNGIRGELKMEKCNAERTSMYLEWALKGTHNNLMQTLNGILKFPTESIKT